MKITVKELLNESDKTKYQFLSDKAKSVSELAKGSEKSALHIDAARAHMIAAKNCDDVKHIKNHLINIEHHLNKIK